MSLAVKRTNTLAYNWSDKHKDYMRNTQSCSMNIAEGSIRSGKTTDNIFADGCVEADARCNLSFDFFKS